MANNIVLTNAYQLNQHPIPLTQVTLIGFPTQASVIGDCLNSPARHLSTGVDVYSFVQVPSGDKYYCQQTVAQLASLFNA